jgi:RNA polymerase sigma factor (sigma-70 family)
MAKVPPDLLLHRLRELGGAHAPNDLSDAELVRRFASYHDEAAFAVLLRRHGPMVLGVCRRVLRDWHDAEDAFQATFLVLARNASSIRKQGSVGSWLYGVARQLALRSKAGAARRREREMQPAPCAVAGPEEAVSGNEVAAVIDEELARLPERYRAPLVLCHVAGLTREAAARQLGWSLRTLMRRLESGRELLRSRLARRGLAPAAAVCAAGLSQQLSSAAVPSALAGAALQGALRFAGAATGATSTPAVALAEGFLRTASLGKLRLALAVMAACVLMAGSGLAAYHALAPTNPPPPPATPVTADAGTVPERDHAGEPARPRTPGPVMARDHETGGGVASCVAFAPVGNLAAAGSDKEGGGVRVWEADTGKDLYRIKLESGVSALAFTHDGETLAVGGGDPTVLLVNAATGKERRRLRGHEKPVTSLTFSPDNKTLISGSLDGTARVWNVADGTEVWKFKAPDYSIHSLALSPDGTTLAAGYELIGGRGHSFVVLWDVVTHRQIRPQALHEGDLTHAQPIRALLFAGDGKSVVSGSLDGSVIRWDVKTGKMIRRYSTPAVITWCVQALAFSPDEKTLVVGDNDGQVLCWEAETGRLLGRSLVTASDGMMRDPGIRSVAFSPDGTVLAVCGFDDLVRLRKVGKSGSEKR